MIDKMNILFFNNIINFVRGDDEKNICIVSVVIGEILFVKFNMN